MRPTWLMEYSSIKRSSKLPLNIMKENLEIIMNKKVVSSARAIKLNVSLHCSKCVQYCVLWQRVKRGNFQWFLMKQQIKIIFWQGDHPITKKKKHFSHFPDSNRNLYWGCTCSLTVILKGNVPFTREHAEWLEILDAWHHLSLVLNIFDRHFWNMFPESNIKDLLQQ